jgi:hypothetical protein
MQQALHVCSHALALQALGTAESSQFSSVRDSVSRSALRAAPAPALRARARPHCASTSATLALQAELSQASACSPPALPNPAQSRSTLHARGGRASFASPIGHGVSNQLPASCMADSGGANGMLMEQSSVSSAWRAPGNQAEIAAHEQQTTSPALARMLRGGLSASPAPADTEHAAMQDERRAARTQPLHDRLPAATLPAVTEFAARRPPQSAPRAAVRASASAPPLAGRHAGAAQLPVIRESVLESHPARAHLFASASAARSSVSSGASTIDRAAALLDGCRQQLARSAALSSMWRDGGRVVSAPGVDALRSSASSDSECDRAAAMLERCRHALARSNGAFDSSDAMLCAPAHGAQQASRGARQHADRAQVSLHSRGAADLWQDALEVVQEMPECEAPGQGTEAAAAGRLGRVDSCMPSSASPEPLGAAPSVTGPRTPELGTPPARLQHGRGEACPQASSGGQHDMPGAGHATPAQRRRRSDAKWQGLAANSSSSALQTPVLLRGGPLSGVRAHHGSDWPNEPLAPAQARVQPGGMYRAGQEPLFPEHMSNASPGPCSPCLADARRASGHGAQRRSGGWHGGRVGSMLSAASERRVEDGGGADALAAAADELCAHLGRSGSLSESAESALDQFYESAAF